jgi:hypothetical protein
MNPLDSELKTLIKWARKAPLLPPPPMPLGFAARIAARQDRTPPIDMLAIWQKAIWGSAGAAIIVIVLGLVVLSAEKLRTKSAYDFSPAYQVVATTIIP